MSSNGYHDKIRKILAMLEGAKTEGEAKAANLALQRLLAKSNLTAEQVGALGSEDPSASIEEEPVYIGSNDVVWKRMLASAIAENLRCRVMLTAFPDKPRAKIIVFVGHVEDAAVASECYRLTLKVAQRCLKRYSKSCRDSGCPIDVTRYADTLLSLHRLSLVRTHATPQTHVAWVLLLFSDSHRLSEQRERIHRRKPFNERKRVHHLKPFQSVASAVREPL